MLNLSVKSAPSGIFHWKLVASDWKFIIDGKYSKWKEVQAWFRTDITNNSSEQPPSVFVWTSHFDRLQFFCAVEKDYHFKNIFSIGFPRIFSEAFPQEMFWDVFFMVFLIASHYWFRWWLGAIRQQAITWANVDNDDWQIILSLRDNELRLNHALHLKCQFVFILLKPTFK